MADVQLGPTTPADTGTPSASPAGGSQTYSVQAGDSLSSIAQKYGTTASNITGYRSGNPNLIYPGENLTVTKGPANPAQTTPPAPLPTGPANTVGASNLTVTPYVTPSPQASTATAGLLALAKNTSDKINQLQPVVDQGKTDITAISNKLAQEPSQQNALYESSGVNADNVAVQDTQTKIDSLDTNYQAQIDQVKNSNPTGQLSTGQQIQLNAITKDYASAKANLSIVLSTQQGNYTRAKSLVDAKITAETDALKQQLSTLTNFYNENYSQLTTAQKDLVTQQTNILTQQLSDTKSTLSTIGTIQIDAAKGGAPASVIEAIGNASDVTTATTLAGEYLEKANTAANSSTITEGGYRFTKTSLNKGASKAGLNSTDFAALDPDVKNFFINNTAAAKAYTSAVSSVKNGEDPQKYVDQINSSNLPTDVQSYLTSQLTSISPTKKSSGGILSTIGNGVTHAWNGLRNILGI